MKELIIHLKILCEPYSHKFDEEILKINIEQSIICNRSIDDVVRIVKETTKLTDLPSGVYMKIINLVK